MTTRGHPRTVRKSAFRCAFSSYAVLPLDIKHQRPSDWFNVLPLSPGEIDVVHG